MYRYVLHIYLLKKSFFESEFAVNYTFSFSKNLLGCFENSSFFLGFFLEVVSFSLINSSPKLIRNTFFYYKQLLSPNNREVPSISFILTLVLVLSIRENKSDNLPSFD